MPGILLDLDALKRRGKYWPLGKKMVLLLNKIDLIPQNVLRQWLSYFRKWYTVMPFKANIQKQSTNLSIVKGKIPNRSDLSLKQGLGVDGLLSLLGNISRSCTGKLTVGVIGIPNTGKSAVINTLIRRRVAPSSCVPGLTKECQLFNLDNKVKLIDSPGIVLSKSEDPSELALRNCAKPETLSEPEQAVSAILQRCPKRQIIVQYSISDFSSTTDFLCQLAQRMGKLKKGGVPDSRGAARIIISDWITGKLSHYTLPPESGAPIAEPSMSDAIAIDPTDFPLQEHDEQVFAAMPMKLDNDFCPPAVHPASQPFTTFANEVPLESAPDNDAEDAADESEAEADKDEEEFESATEDSSMETE
uniref:G domain-containing protein n=1 Tax=Schistocephalus solidus TaxID=70667 RepID=A0A0X3NGW7_SCHSO